MLVNQKVLLMRHKWLQQDAQAMQRIRDSTAPVSNDAGVAKLLDVTCPLPVHLFKCCANAAETGLGAVVGAGVGACMGCGCAIAFQETPKTAHQ